MKKFILALSLAFLTISPSLMAQETEDLRDEISVGYGYVTLYQTAFVLGGVFATVFSAGYAHMGDFVMPGALSIGYDRKLTDVCTIGAVSTYEYVSYTVRDKNNDVTDHSKQNIVSIMPSLKLYWFRHPRFAMYSKIAGGGAASFAKSDDGGSATFTWAAQVSPISMEFGASALRGYVETGFGFQGLVSAGLRYRF